jgi:Zn-dependent peptidase ImmA (M78 family)
MGRATLVPITPAVLQWAIRESGYEEERLAHEINVPPSLLRLWVSGDDKPTVTDMRRLASKLHRPFATFLLPEPPESRRLAVEFRHPADEDRELNPSERRHLRRASRFQEILSWLAGELDIQKSRTPLATVSDDPVAIAKTAREALRVSVIDQKRWPSASVAFDEWRNALEESGHLVFLFSIGKESCSGFSLWNDLAPIVAVNTAWNESARIFTLFHEMGHLITRTSSACVESVRATAKTDQVERWCEKFAAALLMPGRDVEVTLRELGVAHGSDVADLRVAQRISNLYKVSLRAAVIRMIELRAATWDLYRQIPPLSDSKPPGGGGTGRNRTQIREDQLGDRATALLVTAVERDVLDRSQAVEILDIPDTQFDELVQTRRRSM